MSKLLSKQRLATARATATSLLSRHLLDHIDAQAERIEKLKAALMDLLCDSHDDPRAFAGAAYLADDADEDAAEE